MRPFPWMLDPAVSRPGGRCGRPSRLARAGWAICLAAGTFLLSVSADGGLGAQSTPLGAPAAGGVLGFGVSVAMEAGTLAVGRPGEVGFFPMPPSAPGGVHLFARGADGAWSERQVVTGSAVEPGDGFGSAVALAGDLLAVGAPGTAEGRGALFVFERTAPDGEWREVARLALPDGGPGAALGFAVAVVGETVLAGAPGVAEERGAVRAFARHPSTGRWDHEAELRAPDGEPGDRFGAALDTDGARLLAGAPGPDPIPALLDPPPPPRPGAAYVYRPLGGGEWAAEGRLQSVPEGARALGSALLLRGDEAWAGAPMTRGGTGAVHHFRRSAQGWRWAGTLEPPSGGAGSLFGVALAAAGREVLVGAPFRAGGAGGVDVFRRDEASGDWLAVQSLAVKAPGFALLAGSSLAATDGLAFLGAPGADFFEGMGYLFVRNRGDGSWTEADALEDGAAALEAVRGREVACAGGEAAGFGCRDVDLLAFVPARELGAARGIMLSDVWGWTDPETEREYALVGRFDGTAFVDVTDPLQPVFVGELPLTEGAVGNLWRDIKVHADHAFVVADGAGSHGMQVFDLTRLREVEEAPVTFRPDTVYDRIHSAHNLAVNPESGFAYVVGASMGGETCGGGLHMVDVRSPRDPSFAGCHTEPTAGLSGQGFVHDAQCVTYRGPDEAYRGREICFNASESHLVIVDVTDKASPRTLATASYPGVAYAHQGWLTEDQRHFFLGDELDEMQGTAEATRTLVWDVASLEDPVLAAEYLAETGATDHNLYVRGRLMYQSNYVSGLRVLDISDPLEPVEIGFFDTVVGGDEVPGFAGSWSNYPYFSSGVVVVTSMREGLFLLRIRESRATR